MRFQSFVLLLLSGYFLGTAPVARATPEERALAAIADRVSERSAQLRTYQRTCQQLVVNAQKVQEYGAFLDAAEVQINSANAIYQRGKLRMQSDPEFSMRSFNQAVSFLETALRYLHNSCLGARNNPDVRETCASQPSIVERAFTPIVGGTTRQALVRSVCGPVREFNAREFSSLSQTIPVQFVMELTANPQDLAPTSPAPDCETTSAPSLESERRRARRPGAAVPSEPALTPQQEEEMRRLMAAQEARARRQREEQATERRRRNRRPPQVRTEAVIRQGLASALSRADTAHSQMIPSDVDFFLARAELSAGTRRPPLTQGEWEDAVAKWNRSQEYYSSIANDETLSIDERRGRIMNALVADYLTSYERESADPLDALLGKGGNCQTRMHAINAVLSRHPHLIPPGYQLGMAVSTGHVEAVLISTDPAHNETYIDLLTNRRYSTRMRDVFTPLTSMRTFLEGREAVVESRDLLAHRSSQIQATPLTARSRAQSELRPNMAGSQEFPSVEHTAVDPTHVPLHAEHAPPPIQTVRVPDGGAQASLPIAVNQDQGLRRVENPQAVIAAVRDPELRGVLTAYTRLEHPDQAYTNFYLNTARANPNMTIAEFRRELVRYTDDRVRRDASQARAGIGGPVDGLLWSNTYGDALNAAGLSDESSLELQRLSNLRSQAYRELMRDPARLAHQARVYDEQIESISDAGLSDDERIDIELGNRRPPSLDPLYREPSLNLEDLQDDANFEGYTADFERLFTDPTLFGYEVSAPLLLANMTDAPPQSTLSSSAGSASRSPAHSTPSTARPPYMGEALRDAAMAQHLVTGEFVFGGLRHVTIAQLNRGEIAAAQQNLPRLLAAREAFIDELLAADSSLTVCPVRICDYNVRTTTEERSCEGATTSLSQYEAQLCPASQ